MCCGANHTFSLDIFRRHEAIGTVCEGNENAPGIASTDHDIWSLSVIHAESVHDQQSLVRQDGESHFVRTEQGDKDRFEFSYKQLWMYAMRYASHLVSDPIMCEDTIDPSCDQMPTSIVWYRFAQLAFRLGFRSRRIALMSSASALDKIVFKCVSWVAGAAKGGISPQLQVAEVRKRLQIETDMPLEKAPSLIMDDQDVEVQNRLGHYDVDYPQKGKLELFVRWLYNVEEPRGKYITPSFIRKAMFHAFFGLGMRSRDKLIIGDEQNETKTQTTSQDVLPVPFPSSTHRNPCKAPELGDHHIIHNHQSSHQGSADPSFATFAHVNPPSGCTDTSSPRGEERGPQKTMTDMIMILQELERLRTCNSQQCSDTSTCYPASVTQTSSSPTDSQNPEKEETASKSMLSDRSLEGSSSTVLKTAESATPAGWKVNPQSLSPLTLAQPSGLRQSILEPSFDDAIESNAGKKLSSRTTSVFEVVPHSASSSSADLDNLISFDDPDNTSAAIKQDPGISKCSYWSPAMTSHLKSRQQKQSSSVSPNSHEISYFNVPLAQIEQCESIIGHPLESTELVSSHLYQLSGQEQENLKAPAVTKAESKRVREIVEESLSCVHDCAKYSATAAGRKGRKRSFQEYNACSKSVDTQGVRTIPW